MHTKAKQALTSQHKHWLSTGTWILTLSHLGVKPTVAAYISLDHQHSMLTTELHMAPAKPLSADQSAACLT